MDVAAGVVVVVVTDKLFRWANTARAAWAAPCKKAPPAYGPGSEHACSHLERVGVGRPWADGCTRWSPPPPSQLLSFLGKAEEALVVLLP